MSGYDPTTAHHEGPFPVQQQPEQPGLTEPVSPRPDHGERSAYVYLASDEATYTSGAIIPVTGGRGF